MANINEQWNNIFNDYKALDIINQKGFFAISANQIKEYYEPRLITKFDSFAQMPTIFKDNHLGILPTDRGDYIIGKYNCFQPLPEWNNDDIKRVDFPNWIQSIDPNNLFSESIAISAAMISPIFKDFFNGEDFVSTVSGRMGSGNFAFTVSGASIVVNNSQIEIDGALENKKRFVIIEAKNKLRDDFIIRQLYYPLRKYQQLVDKYLNTVFLEYSNGIFRVLEYQFSDLMVYDSIYLVKEKKYSIDTTLITIKDIEETVKNSQIDANDYGAPFPQCDDFFKIISLMEQLNDKPLTKAEIRDSFGFVDRQADYYFNGLRYLGLADIDKGECFLTPKGIWTLTGSYKDRQLKLVRIICEKPIFNILIKNYLNSKEIPDKQFIIATMKDLNLFDKASMVIRRSSTVNSWLNWIIDLIN